MKDRSFDGIAAKFDKNIYGTSKGKLRHEMLCHHLAPFIKDGQGKRALDAGGGTGEFALTLAEHGFDVLLNDISQDTLDIARSKLRDKRPELSPKINFHCGEIAAVSDAQLFDFIACHAVLEWLVEPEDAIRKLVQLVKPGGIISLSFFNADANVFGNLLYGNFELVANDMQQKNRLQLANHRPLSPHKILDVLNTLPVQVVESAGVRCFHDYLRDKSQQESEYPALLAAEKRFSTREPYKWLGKYFQVIIKKQDL
ncbi:MAG: methyltransferase domain-containing protein [Aestuariibacter sp.]